MYIVMGDKVNAVQKAREHVKAGNNDLRMFETPTGRFIITERDLTEDYEEVQFKLMSREDIKNLEEIVP